MLSKWKTTNRPSTLKKKSALTWTKEYEGQREKEGGFSFKIKIEIITLEKIFFSFG